MTDNGAVLTQPQKSEPTQYWQSKPIPGCPQGLESLASVTKLMVKQDVTWGEVCGWRCKNKYRVLDTQNQQLFYMSEESHLWGRIWCGPNRGFVAHVLDNQQQEVMQISRPFGCCKGAYCCADGCCMYPNFINDKSGNKMGMMRPMNFCCSSHFGVFDENDKLLFDLRGPCCPCQCWYSCTSDIEFPVRSESSDQVIGSINKVWAGTMKEIFTDADNYSVTVPQEMEVKHKALLLAAVIMVDFYFEVLDERKNPSLTYSKLI